MPPNLVDLPQDVLDQFFELLLPPLNPSLPLYRNPTLPVPVDLHKVMLVCRRLRDIALPWAWRRISLDICVSEQYSDWDEFRNLLENQQGPRLRHPTRFAHIRVFVLTIHILNIGEANDPAPVSKTLKKLKSCVSLMENLQVFILECLGPYPTLVDDIYASLVSKPRLHTLVTSYHTPAVHSSLTSLKHLRVHSTREWLRVAPVLESLSFSFLDSQYVPTSPIPWATLREIDVHDVLGVDAISKGFSTWKQTFPETRSPLNEISIDTQERFDVSGILDQMFRVFRSQDIHTFSLRGLRSVDAELIDRIAEAFPGLKSLTLTATKIFTWSLSSVAVALSRFPMLRELQWDFQDEALFKQLHEADLDDPDIGPQRFIPSIAAHCKVLEYVTFFHWFVHRTYSINRDGTGRYVGCQLVEEASNTGSWSTSSWNPTGHAWI